MNYTEITEAARKYADRSDIEVIEMMSTFIKLTEARINRLLKTREQSARIFAYTIENEEYYSLPPDYAGMRDIQINSDSVLDVSTRTETMHYLSPEQLNQKKSQPSSGMNYYCIIANQIQIYPPQPGGKSLEIIYYQKVPALTPAEPFASNWLSISSPDIYISGLTAEISVFAKDYDVANLWYLRMSEAIDELDNSDATERWSGTPLTVRIG